MRDRRTLHLSQVDAFAAYMATRGYRREPVNENHGYEVLRLRPAKGKVLIFHRHDRGEHVTVRGQELRAVRDFIEYRKAHGGAALSHHREAQGGGNG